MQAPGPSVPSTSSGRHWQGLRLKVVSQASTPCSFYEGTQTQERTRGFSRVALRKVVAELELEIIPSSKSTLFLSTAWRPLGVWGHCPHARRRVCIRGGSKEFILTLYLD